MFWKLLFVSFVLKNNRINRMILMDSVSNTAIPKRQRSNSDEFDLLNQPINVIQNRSRQPFFYNRSGYDERYNSSKYPSDQEDILNLTRFYHQMELLKKLESEKVSQPNKVKLVEEYNKNEQPSPMVPDILSGELYKDWEWEYK